MRGGGGEEGRKEVLILFSWPHLWAQPVILYLLKRPGREGGEIVVKGMGCRARSGHLTRRRAGSFPPAVSDGSIPPSPPGIWVYFEENEKL